MFILIFFFVSLISTEEFCYLPVIFHKFDNCPTLIRRTHPDPPEHEPFNLLCMNEGTCKKTGFYTESEQFDANLNEYFVEDLYSYEGFCLKKLGTAELLGNVSDCCLEYRHYNFYIRICRDDIAVHDGVKFSEEQVCSDCTPKNFDLLHVFILIDYNENTGFTSADIIINKELVWTVNDFLLKSGERLLHIYDGKVYQYAMFEHKLDMGTINRFTDIGLGREASQEYCIDEYSEGERIYDEIVVQHNNLLIVYLIAFGVLFVILIVFVIVAICIIAAFQRNLKIKK